MEPSLSLVPTKTNTTGQVSIASTASPLGLHDAMRYGGARSLAADVAPKHPLQERLENWEESRENLELTMQRNLYGLHAPVRLLMERSLVGQTALPQGFSVSGRPANNLHLDILLGKDEEIEISDVLIDRATTSQVESFGVAMERKLRML